MVETMDLADILRTATEEKITLDLPSTTDTPAADGSDAQVPDPYKDDFDQETLQQEMQNEPDPGLDAAGKAAESLFDTAQLAPALIDGLDMLQRTLYPKAYESMLSREDRIAMKSLIRQYRTAKNKSQISLSENDQRIMEIMCDYEEYKESIPMTPAEKKSMIVPLREVLKKMNFQPTPEAALLYAAMMTTLPRVAPLVLKKTGIFEDNQEDGENIHQWETA